LPNVLVLALVLALLVKTMLNQTKEISSIFLSHGFPNAAILIFLFLSCVYCYPASDLQTSWHHLVQGYFSLAYKDEQYT